MSLRWGLVLVSIILIIGGGVAYLAFQYSSRAGDVAWVKSATEMCIDGYEQSLSGEGLSRVLDQFGSPEFSDALLLGPQVEGTLKIDGREHRFESLEEKVVGGAQLLRGNKGIRAIYLTGPRNPIFWVELRRTMQDQTIEQDYGVNGR